MTTNRSLSWIDRDRFAGLIAQVTDAPPAPQAVPRPLPRGRSGSVKALVSAAIAVPTPAPAPAPARRHAPSVPPPTLPAMPSTAPRPPVSSGVPEVPAAPVASAPLNLAPPPPAVKAYAAFAPTSKNLEDRLQQLVAWIEDCVPCRAAFIADDNGLPVVEHVAADPGEIAAASQILLMLASVRSLMRDSGGWLSLKLGTAILNVVEVATQWGRFGIGIVTDDALPREFLAVLGVAVERAFLGDAAPSPLGDAS